MGARAAHLDGVRGLAAMTVVASHVVPGWAPAGTWAVEVFFTLSGFLMTRMLVARTVAGLGGVIPFWRARFRRLAPPLFVMLAAVLAITGLLAPGDLPRVTTECLSAALFITDFQRLAGVLPPFVGHTWSLAVEAQYYLAWPLCLGWFRRRRSPAVALWLAAVALATVALVAPPRLAVMIPWAFLAGGALALRPLAAPSWAVRALSWRPLTRLGVLSYGIYLWHVPIITVFFEVPWPQRLVLASVLSGLLSILSYLTVERWAGCARAPL